MDSLINGYWLLLVFFESLFNNERVKVVGYEIYN